MIRLIDHTSKSFVTETVNADFNEFSLSLDLSMSLQMCVFTSEQTVRFNRLASFRNDYTRVPPARFAEYRNSILDGSYSTP